MRGHGKSPIEERLLEANWGSDAGYAARNSTLNLAGLNYSIPLSWQKTIAGHGLWVMEPPTPSRWKGAALYPTGITILPGERVQVRVEVVGDQKDGPLFARIPWSEREMEEWIESPGFVDRGNSGPDHVQGVWCG